MGRCASLVVLLLVVSRIGVDPSAAATARVVTFSGKVVDAGGRPAGSATVYLTLPPRGGAGFSGYA